MTTDEDFMDTGFKAEIRDYFKEEGRTDWRNAWKMLWTTRRGDLESNYISWPARLALRLLCSLALLLRRTSSDHINGLRNGLDMGYWDYEKLYAGWSCKTMSFNWKLMEYEIGSDGDWSM